MMRCEWRWVAMMLLVACGGGEREPPEPVVPRGIEVVGGEVDEEGAVWLRFGTLVVGEGRDLSVDLRNEGEEAATLSIVAPGPPFLITEAPAALGPGQEGRVRVRFHPRTIGAFEEEAKLRSDLGGIDLRLVGEAEEAAPCELSAAPAELRFTVAEDEPVYLREGRVRITNQGEQRCRIDSMRSEGDALFLPTADLEPFELEPGARRELSVYAPARPGTEGALVVSAGEIELRVPIGTKEENDCLRAKETEELLEVVGLGCGPARLVIENVCGEPLAVDASGTSGFNSRGGQSPAVLPAEGSAEFTISYGPISPPWEREGEYVVQADNGDRIRQKVAGRLKGVHEEFDARPEWTLDILFVLDVGESLAAYQDALDAYAAYYARQMDYDWRTEMRVHVTTTSMEAAGECAGEAGGLVPLDGSRPRTVTWETPEREEVLLENLRAPACSEAGGAGFAAIEAAVGEGWPPWREGELHVLLFSAEDDTSPLELEHYQDLFETPLDEARRYLDRFDLFVPTRNCEELEAAPRYFGILPSGRATPICFASNFVPAAGGIGFEADLSHLPPDLDGNGRVDARDGIEVSVDGREWATTQYYVDEGRLIISSSWGGYPPVMRGARVEIRYPLSCL